jgi:hypothetical protein
MRAAKLFLCLSLPVLCVSGQQPAPAPAESDPSPPAASRTQREKQIRMIDPLDKSNPMLDQRNQGPDTPDPVTGAQPAPPPTLTRPNPGPRPLAGSVAESNLPDPANPKNQGPQVLSEDGDAPVQEYNGPAVLSRSYTISRPTVPKQVRWSPFLSYMQTFDSGLDNKALLLATGRVAGSSIGYSAGWGVTGRHFWKHDQFGLDYHGSQVKLGGVLGFAGTNHSLNADYEHQVSRRLVLNVVTSASSLSQSYALDNPGLIVGGSASNPGSIANISLAASPTVQLLDQGLRQLSNQVSMTFKKSARLSFSLSSGVFFVQRNGGLFGNTGYQSQADVNYRYTRRTTIGVYYSHSNYLYTHRINVSDLNTVGGIYSYALGRSTQIKVRAGLTRIENQGLQTVSIDPAIAVYLGQSVGVIEAYSLNLTTDISAELSRDFGRRNTASVSYARGASPGNGLLLTSIQEGLTGSFTSKMIRNYAVTVSAGSSSLTSAAGSGAAASESFATPVQSLGNYSMKSFSLGFTRPLRHSLSAEVRVDYRLFDISAQPYLRHQLRISTGISWDPKEKWLKSW